MPNPNLKPAHALFWSKMKTFFVVETQKETIFFAHGGGRRSLKRSGCPIEGFYARVPVRSFKSPHVAHVWGPLAPVRCRVVPCGAVGPAGRDHCAKKSHRVAKERPHSPAQDLWRTAWDDGMIVQGLLAPLAPPRKHSVRRLTDFYIKFLCILSSLLHKGILTLKNVPEHFFQ